jgi:hypothetical protein
MTWGPTAGSWDVHRTVERHAQTHETGGEDVLFGLMPVGACFWWWGTPTQLADRAPGWRIVDGTFEVNGATPPNMANRMPVGAGSTYALGDTGGAATATPSAHTGTDVDGHTGGAVTGSHTASHDHSITRASSTGDIVPGAVPFVSSVNTPTGNQSASPSTHGFTQPDPHDVTQPDDHDAISTLPPYAAFYFVMRVR